MNKRLAALDAPYFWERFFYRHHRVWGAIIIAGAAYAAITLLRLDDPAGVANALGLPFGASANLILVQSVHALLLLGSLLALPFGCVVLIRPSLLKRVERQANREL